MILNLRVLGGCPKKVETGSSDGSWELGLSDDLYTGRVSLSKDLSLKTG